jgi:hypothetical protein
MEAVADMGGAGRLAADLAERDLRPRKFQNAGLRKSTLEQEK